MSIFNRYSKIFLGLATLSALALPTSGQAAGFNPALRNAAKYDTAPVRGERGDRGSRGEVRTQRNRDRGDQGARSQARGNRGNREVHDRPVTTHNGKRSIRHSGSRYIVHNRPLYRHRHVRTAPRYYPRYRYYGPRYYYAPKYYKYYYRPRVRAYYRPYYRWHRHGRVHYKKPHHRHHRHHRHGHRTHF